MDIFNKKKLAKLQSELDVLQKEFEQCSNDLSKYQPIIDIEKETSLKLKELDSINEKIESLKAKYKEGKTTYDELKEEIGLYKDNLEYISYGIYEPVFDYEDSESYKEAIKSVIQEQKELISQDEAIKCYTDWLVDGSESKGRVMIKRKKKLMLRAFNGECNTLISKVRWNNVQNMEVRILKAANSINNLGKSNSILIEKPYWELKVEELKLTHEYHLKKHQEKEEQREIRARIREEEKAQRDFERAKKEAEIEERRYQKALEKAQKDLGLVSGEELNKLQGEIDKLKQNLEEVKAHKERALSMAQQTRAGYVYVISNIGSFGENVYKIGLTRRLEPLDRVRELGDSSVPFRFDVHALIYSDDAPKLENELHNAFKEKSVNLVNFRKEFFNVSLEEIKRVVKNSFDKEVEFIELSEAKEYRESLAISKQMAEEETNEETRFPEELFD